MTNSVAVVEPSPAGEGVPLEPRAPAERRGRGSLVMLAGALAGGNLLSSFLRMAGGILQAKFVLPEVLGLFNGIGLVLGYAPFLQLGILNGLNRELPYFIGKGDRARVNELAAAAQAWAIAVSAVVSTTLLAVAGWHLLRGAMWEAAGWATNAVMAFILFYSTTYLQTTYRTAHDFARLAMVNVVQNAVALVLVVLVAVLSFYGMCLRAIISGAAGMALLYWWRPVRVGPKWNLGHLKHLLVIGAPIFGVGQLYAWWSVVDPTLVLLCTGTYGMGLYAMVMVAGSTVELLPSAVSQIVYPRMAEHFGRTHRLADLLRMSVKPTAITAAAMVPTIALAWILVEPVVQWILPKYVEAVPAMRWSLLVPFLSSFFPVLSVFNVVRRQDLYVVAILLGMGTYVGTLMWLVSDMLPPAAFVNAVCLALSGSRPELPPITNYASALVAFPQAMLAGRAVFVVVCYAFVAYLARKHGTGAC